MPTRSQCESFLPPAQLVPLPADTPPPDGFGSLPAISAERLHSVLRRMPEADWAQFQGLLRAHLQEPEPEQALEMLERLFRKGEALSGQAGGKVLQRVQEIARCPALMDYLRKAQERLRERVRFCLREMGAGDWEAFRSLLAQELTSPAKAEDLGVLELVFRIGESITNVETAALALSDQDSGRKPIQPEVARKNAQMRVPLAGAPRLDPEAAYQAAKQAIETAQETALRAASTLAYHYVAPSPSYKHARHTIFRTVDAIVERGELMAAIARIETQLLAVPPVTREEMRWALHRMPMTDRLEILKRIPLNTILMFQEGAGKASAPESAFRAIRDRRLAYDYFVRGHSVEALVNTYGLSTNAVKNELGTILENLVARPLARQGIHSYLARVKSIPSMGLDEVRRRMKQLTSQARAQLLNRIPNSAWKARDIMLLHKQLFLDYLSGEWLLAALVDYYNLEKAERIAGRFKFEGTLTIRGAHAAIAGMLHKIAAEPDLRARLAAASTFSEPAVPAAAEEDLGVECLLPPPPAVVLEALAHQ